MEQYLLVAEIVKPQGVHGEVKARPYTDDIHRFETIDRLYVKTPEGIEPREVKCNRVHEGFVYLTFPGVASRAAAEGLRGTMLYIDREHAAPLSEDEAYIVDLIGCEAVDTQGNPMGTLIDVLQPGSLDVYVFRREKGTMMIPALKAAIPTVDVKAKRIVLNEEKLPEVAVFED